MEELDNFGFFEVGNPTANRKNYAKYTNIYAGLTIGEGDEEKYLMIRRENDLKPLRLGLQKNFSLDYNEYSALINVVASEIFKEVSEETKKELFTYNGLVLSLMNLETNNVYYSMKLNGGLEEIDREKFRLVSKEKLMDSILKKLNGGLKEVNGERILWTSESISSTIILEFLLMQKFKIGNIIKSENYYSKIAEDYERQKYERQKDVA